MDNMPIGGVLINGIAEAVILIYLGLLLVGIKASKRRVFIAGLIQAVICYYLGRIFNFGIHTFMKYVSFVLLTWLIVQVPILVSGISNCMACVIALLLGNLNKIILPHIIGISMEEILSRYWLRNFCFLPYLLIIFTITYLVGKYNFTLEEEIKILRDINRGADRIKG